jgi:prepilin-type N-terminal cleavage/methylation domain-containing protein
MSKRSRGFTLIELLVVMTIMAIVLAGSVAGFFGMGSGSRMRSSVDTFRSTIGVARQRAVFKGDKVMLRVRQNADDNWYYYLEASGTRLGERYYLPPGIEMDGNSDMDIPFYPTGGAKDPNEYRVILRQEASDEERWTITIFGLTGMVYVEESN